MDKDFKYKIIEEINGWVKSWMIETEDIHIGGELEEVFKAFMLSPEITKLTDRTVKKHLENLFILGGQIISNINIDNDLRRKNGIDLLMESIDEDGGPYTSHIESESELRSFDATCKKLYKFMKNWSNKLGTSRQ